MVPVLSGLLLILQSVQSFDIVPPFCFSGDERRLLDDNFTDDGDLNFTDFGDTDGSDSCNPECEKGVEFCGKDGLCYPQSCSNFYQWGNANFTGIIGVNVTDIPPLDCEAVTQSIYNIPVSTSYGCVGINCLTTRVEQQNSLLFKQQNSLLFNKVCMAQLNDTWKFVCYELAEDTSFDAYTNFTASSEGIDCPYYPYDPVENVTEPSHIYQTSISRWTANSQYYVIVGPEGLDSTFNESLAFATFSSRLQRIESTNVPTAAPTITKAPSFTEAPAPPTSSGSMASSTAASLLASMVVCLVVAIW
jgi:hypothetical protein